MIGDTQTDSGQPNDDWFGQNAPPAAPQSAAPTPAPTSTPGGVAPKSIKDPNAFRDAWLQSGGKTVDDLKAFVAAHPEFDVTITGSKGSKVLIGGQAFQAVRSAGIGGGIGGAWDPLGAEGGGGGGMSSLAGDFGSFAKGYDKTFAAPSIEEIRNTPGYQFALTQGIDALDKRAAAQGTVLGGGEKKNVMEFATGLADQTAQQKYQNALGEYKMAYDIFRNNQNDVFDRFDRLSSRGTTAAGTAAS